MPPGPFDLLPADDSLTLLVSPRAGDALRFNCRDANDLTLGSVRSIRPPPPTSILSNDRRLGADLGATGTVFRARRGVNGDLELEPMLLSETVLVSFFFFFFFFLPLRASSGLAASPTLSSLVIETLCGMLGIGLYL